MGVRLGFRKLGAEAFGFVEVSPLLFIWVCWSFVGKVMIGGDDRGSSKRQGGQWSPVACSECSAFRHSMR